jgi:hypothetical protein
MAGSTRQIAAMSRSSAAAMEHGVSTSVGWTNRKKRSFHMSERELVKPHPGDKRYQRRDEDGKFSDSDDQSKSLSQDVQRHSNTEKPRNQGDRGD